MHMWWCMLLQSVNWKTQSCPFLIWSLVAAGAWCEQARSLSKRCRLNWKLHPRFPLNGEDLIVVFSLIIYYINVHPISWFLNLNFLTWIIFFLRWSKTHRGSEIKNAKVWKQFWGRLQKICSRFGLLVELKCRLIFQQQFSVSVITSKETINTF